MDPLALTVAELAPESSSQWSLVLKEPGSGMLCCYCRRRPNSPLEVMVGFHGLGKPSDTAEGLTLLCLEGDPRPPAAGQQMGYVTAVVTLPVLPRKVFVCALGVL